MTPEQYLNLVKQSLQMDLDGTKQMMENHMHESQELIANISVLRDLEGNSDALALAALEVAARNPQSGEMK